MASALQLRIHSVRCVDETGGRFAERFGNDEIYMGGHAMLGDGSTSVVPAFSVYPHFDDGDIKVYNPPRVFHTFALGPSFPQEFAVGLVLIEKDAGGMSDAIKRIADKVETEVRKRLEQPAAMVRQAEGQRALSPLLAQALAYAAPYVIDYVRKKLMGAISDDLFQPQHTTVSIDSANFSWSGSPSSAVKTLTFRDHDGVYQVACDWNLV
ncbi:hypothetical protein [Aquabacterium sp. OR-4]|uniref:hypothetical protein n=1 Tax=Aquabacterium sp. OR-4 TaxID=2978127 RepID=UPI0021B412FB|nr:hypothetical protein [Aquabacterium sp. OR-4]MDT7838267.1 hypothetical protein [Aquabacterium sp. OR-4]